jgi:hypothetical protein
VYYVTNTRGAAQEDDMDLSRIQPRDWMIAIAAFIAGAWIF